MLHWIDKSYSNMSVQHADRQNESNVFLGRTSAQLSDGHYVIIMLGSTDKEQTWQGRGVAITYSH